MAAGVCLLAPGAHRLRTREARADGLAARVGPAAWVARLSSADPAARRGALYLLGRFAPPSSRVAEEIVRGIERETDPSVLLAAVDALATGRHPNSTRLLLGFVSAGARASPPPPEVQAAAARALGGVGEPQIAPTLLQVPIYGSAEVVDAAARALARLPDAVFAQLVVTARRQSSQTAMMLRAMGHRGDPRWGTVVLEQLRATSPLVILAALDAAVRLRLVDAAPEIAEIARDASDRHSVRRAAVRALGALGGVGDLDVVRGAIRDPLLREVGLGAAAALGNRELVPELVPLLAAPWAVDRRAAADTLGALGGPLALGALRARLAVERADDVRRALWHAVARVGDEQAWRLLAAHTPTDPGARWAAVEWLRRGDGGGGLGAGLGAAVERRDPSAMALAAQLGAHEAALRAALADRSPDVRASAATALALGRERSDATEAALAARLGTEDDEGVRVALVLALGARDGEVARGAVLALLGREAEAPSLAAAAPADVAGRFGLRRAVGPLRAALGSDAAVVRAVAADALGRIGDPAARPALERLARFDPDPDARGAAAMALARIGGDQAAEVIAAVGRTAWTARLIELSARAAHVAAGVLSGAPFAGSAVVRVSGAPPRSVWALVLPDGGVALTVATGDGEVLIAGAPAGEAPLYRLDAR